MPINLTDGNGEGLFDVLGRFAHVLNDLNANRSDLKTEAEEAWQQSQDANLGLDAVANLARFPSSAAAWLSNGDSYARTLGRVAFDLLEEYVLAAYPSTATSTASLLAKLIEDMQAQGYYVAANAIAESHSGADAGNVPYVLFSAASIAGEDLPMIKQEGITVAIDGDFDDSRPSLRLRGGVRPRSVVAEDYPGGSGLNTTVTPLTPEDSLLENSDFNADLVADELPGWRFVSGTKSEMSLTPWQQHTVTISGSPSSGSYVLQATVLYDNGSVQRVYDIGPLSHDTAGSVLQATLREVPEFASVTVATTGTSPNYAHTITWTGVMATVTLANGTGATVVPAIGQQSETTWTGGLVASGRRIEFGIGASSTIVLQAEVELEPDTMYAMGVYVRRSSGGSWGGADYKLTLAKDASGTAVTRRQGGDFATPNITAASDTARWHAMIGSFAATEQVQEKMYVRLSMKADQNTVVDHVILAPVDQLYSAGPRLALLRGYQPIPVDYSDTINVTNDFASAWHKAFDQFFSSDRLGLVLPTSGSTEIPASLIA